MRQPQKNQKTKKRQKDVVEDLWVKGASEKKVKEKGTLDGAASKGFHVEKECVGGEIPQFRRTKWKEIFNEESREEKENARGGREVFPGRRRRGGTSGPQRKSEKERGKSARKRRFRRKLVIPWGATKGKCRKTRKWGEP